MEKISYKNILKIIDKMDFYNFEDLQSLNGVEIQIKFLDDNNIVTYNDVDTYDKCQKAKNNEENIIGLLKSIFDLTRDKEYIVLKYNERWIVNKKKTKKLYKILRNQNIKNKSTVAVRVEKYSEESKLFINSILKYNTFAIFILEEEQMIIAVSDHMDVFVCCREEIVIEKIKKQVNYKWNGIFKVSTN